MNDGFPIMHSYCVQSIPWEMAVPHARQCERNHQQTLQRLSERGGLDPTEMVAVLEDRRWKMMSAGDANRRLLELVDEWEKL